MDMLISEGSKLMPYLLKEHFIRAFSGTRPKLAGPELGGYLDFVIAQKEETPRFIHLVGIESPGLTSSVPIARDIARMIKKRENLDEKEKFNRARPRDARFNELTDREKGSLIRRNPDHGEIVCRCQQITKQEVLDAIRNPLGAHTVVSIKNRTGCMMGRCQGGFCQTRIVDMIMAETGKTAGEVLYGKTGGNMFFGSVR
jgi:glycerol-3-phosphate dehydrogenase